MPDEHFATYVIVNIMKMREMPADNNESLDGDPSLYKTVIVGNRQEVIDTLKKGSGKAISINMDNYSIYIGEDHYNMQIKYGVPADSLCAAHVYFDEPSQKVILRNFADWRNDCQDNPVARATIEKALKRDLFS